MRSRCICRRPDRYWREARPWRSRSGGATVLEANPKEFFLRSDQIEKRMTQARLGATVARARRYRERLIGRVRLLQIQVVRLLVAARADHASRVPAGSGFPGLPDPPKKVAGQHGGLAALGAVSALRRRASLPDVRRAKNEADGPQEGAACTTGQLAAAQPAERSSSDCSCPTARLPARDGNRVELLAQGRRGVRESGADHRSGRDRTIHITTYILGRDEVGAELVARLAEKRREGVGGAAACWTTVGSWRVGRRFLAPLVKEGARVAYFMPVLHIPFRGRANLRNHRKIVVVDGRVALTGGMNLAWPYMGPAPNPGLWRDLSAVVEGPAVVRPGIAFCLRLGVRHRRRPLGAAAAMEEAAKRSRHERDRSRREPGSDSLVQVVASGPDVPDDPLYETLLSLMFAARERIWVVTPYFVPDEMLAPRSIWPRGAVLTCG